MQDIFSRIKNPALRQGLIFGLAFGFAQVLLSFFITIGLIILLALYFVIALFAGQRASKQTGSLRTGVLAGFWTGLFGSVVFSIIPLIIDFLNLDAVRNNLQSLSNQEHLKIHYDIGLTISSLLINFGLVIILAVLLGLAGGSVGGFMGRNRATPPQEQIEEPMLEPPSTTTQQ